MSPTTVLRSLSTCARVSDAQGLRDLLTDAGAVEALGGRARGLLRLVDGLDDELVSGVRQLLPGIRADAVQKRLSRATEEAGAAAREIARTARWAGGKAHLDVAIVTGPLLVKPGHICFVVDETEVVVPVRLLRRAARATSVFVDRTAHVDRDGFHLRWRGGRGGLSFWSQRVSKQERLDATTVVLSPLETRAGDWLCDVLDELAL